MEQEKRCPECGSTNIGQGKWGGYAALAPVHKLLSLGSEVRAELCTDCGLITAMRVKNPEKFR
ncbi:transcription initiation factor TFIIIB [Dethiobacter alkaliphilus]|uniref:transcription initiation factor TFIIIB n=1 Tax=Dethiobacter alkaliphilus TaxID=427926 RepID=UPI0022279279|nr:transcription initiation factor TFIIIB [Dethiobacter alkaliphilus]MCW3491676.1 transcription initiation factor TFIIIB [Dethiobacter alkaliphilus]